tara:strand:+ start:483 stop:737 length:255 start_codon:yes stop_codon:yes gene_type:complete
VGVFLWLKLTNGVTEMKTVTDTEGNTYQVGKVFLGAAARQAQISPNWGQINLSPVGEGGNHSGHQLPEHVIEAWLEGKIRVKIK